MGPEGAVEIIYRRDLREADDPAARKSQLAAEYRERLANPYMSQPKTATSTM
jgi:acetyl-CoA carboxylase carboxyltransferase component